jgi:hypothetical protein
MSSPCGCGLLDCNTCHSENRSEEKDECGTFDWRSYVMPWGKHKGETFYILYVNYFSYIQWLDEQDLTNFPELKKAIDGAITYKNTRGM